MGLYKAWESFLQVRFPFIPHQVCPIDLKIGFSKVRLGVSPIARFLQIPYKKTMVAISRHFSLFVTVLVLGTNCSGQSLVSGWKVRS